MAIRIQFRRGTAAEWASANPVLAAGELGYESDTGAFKIGNATDNWGALAYSAISQSYVDNALADVVGLAPETLDTLAELAASIGGDANFGNTVTAGLSTLDAHIDDATNVHGIADTAALETQTGAQNKANAAQANAASYTDTAVANLIDSSPGTLNTLNELAAALSDDPNFATTMATSLGGKINFVIDTAANFATANVVTAANTLYIESDHAGFVRVGDGVTHYNSLDFVGKSYADNLMNDHENLDTNVHGISNTANLAYQTDIAGALDAASDVANTLSSHEALTSGVHGIASVADLVVTADLNSAINTHNVDTTNVHGIANTADLVTTSILAAHSDDTTNVHGIADTSTLVIASDLEAYAQLEGPSFTGTVVLPSTTSIGDVSGTELSYVNGVTGAIQTQLDAKLASATAATTYAPLAAPTFTGTVVLPSTTSIGDTSNVEIGYLNGVTSAIQTQIDAKAPTANATFTGTTSGITKSMVGLGDVDNTSDANKPVSIATQSALDAKANLDGAIFTGDVEATNVTITGDLYVVGTTTTVNTANLAVQDNMIYLNNPGLNGINNAIGDGTYVVYETIGNHGYAAGHYVVITDSSPSSFDIAAPGAQILEVTANTFTVASTVTDTYLTGGAARARVSTDPDLGWAAGRYASGTYAHTGMFRDATDGRFKFFDNYVPEPDESLYIDTADASFSFASIEAQNVIANAGVSTGFVAFNDGTQQSSAGVPSISSFIYKTASYTLDNLGLRDDIIEVSNTSATTITIPLDSSVDYPVGTSIDIIQINTGQVTIAGAGGVTVNATPGLKLRTRWSSATLLKRAANTWIVYGDLTA
jgi:hypothetical protein